MADNINNQGGPTPEQIEKRRRELKAKRQRKRMITVFTVVGVLAVAAIAAVLVVQVLSRMDRGAGGGLAGGGTTQTEAPVVTEDPAEAARNASIEQAARLSAQYDYDGAIAVLQAVPGAENDTHIQDLLFKYTTQRDALVEFPISDVCHIFFHTLIPNTDKAFDGDYKQDDYNQVMTTVTEYNRILEQMYANGWVLVMLDDMAGYVTHEDGSVTWEEKKIMLPEGKKAFILSQDDVSYYEYMAGDGYPSRLVVNEEGKVVNEMIGDDGSVTYGSYDCLPLLDDFIEKHPDFSYKGAKGYLALTGYDGVLGYRTAPKYADTNEYPEIGGEEGRQEQIRQAQEVVKAIIDDGWRFASHSWGHRYYGQISYNQVVEDGTKWEEQVRPILESSGTPVDTMIYAFGDDIGSWTPYETSNSKFTWLFDKGFRYYCNVDSNTPWVQSNPALQYLRTGRINLDGQRMYYDMIDDSVDHLSKFFDVNTVFDSARPVPVPK